MNEDFKIDLILKIINSRENRLKSSEELNNKDISLTDDVESVIDGLEDENFKNNISQIKEFYDLSNGLEYHNAGKQTDKLPDDEKEEMITILKEEWLLNSI
ncbi:MAG: hypothetical protein GF383_09275 [Candidatus Lokiarchaeota archaeon]|nr:hypothetical protein [Candidatus Lokiarchaeota archaeon]MBD3340701.1 hypothetical protein [Candidatus Lokiarchaeota archaeon]